MAQFFGERFVDIGGGQGSYAAELLKSCQCLSLVDVDPDAIRQAGALLLNVPKVDLPLFDGYLWAEMKNRAQRRSFLEAVADGVGFEPTDGLRHRRFSRPVP